MKTSVLALLAIIFLASCDVGVNPQDELPIKVISITRAEPRFPGQTSKDLRGYRTVHYVAAPGAMVWVEVSEPDRVLPTGFSPPSGYGDSITYWVVRGLSNNIKLICYYQHRRTEITLS
jgi:hypothetical protein